MNNFKSRIGQSEERYSSKFTKGFRVFNAVEEKPVRFDHREVESCALNDRSLRPAAPPAHCSSSGSLCGRTSKLESTQRSFYEGQSVMGHKTTHKYSSSDESMVLNRVQSKNKKRKSSFKSSPSPSSQDTIKGTGSQSKRKNPLKLSRSVSYDADVGSLQMSSESINTYLAKVSKTLEQEHLLGKLDLSNENKNGSWKRVNNKLNALTSNLTHVTEEVKQNRSMSRDVGRREEAEVALANKNRMMKEDGVSFWSRMRNVFSMTCWKGDNGHNMTSDDQETGSEESSGSEDRNSTSSGTTTVTPDKTGQVFHGLYGAKPDIAPSTSRDNKFITAKFVDSLKRFFWINSRTDNDACQLLNNRVQTFEDIEEKTESDHSEEMSDRTQTDLPLPIRPCSTACTGSAQSTPTSDYEVVDIKPKQRQPM